MYSTAANALASDKTIQPRLARTEARYGRRFTFQELDKATDNVSSGLIATPQFLLHGVPATSARD